jgi:signal transduction histidine kinase/DNA-binding response OmpR family regulator/ABC-type amino acid transport substrate-binding protein
MQKIKQVMGIFLFASLFLIIFSKCVDTSVNQPGLTGDSSFRDIPGITNDEIKAIEEFQRQNRTFIYGVSPSTEAFLKEDGKIGGFTALLCDWLSSVFQIEFQVQIHDWSVLREKFYAGEIDFINLTATEERMKTYFMTDPIAKRSVKAIRIINSQPLEIIALSRPVRYAFMEHTATYETVAAMLTPGTYEVVFVNGYESAYNLIKNADVDAFIELGIAEEAFDNFSDVEINDFTPLVFNPVSMAAINSDLVPVISVITKALRNSALHYLASLYNFGYREYMAHKLSLRLTEEEREFIKNNPIIKMGAQYYNYPIDFFNPHEKEWQGIIFDILEEVSLLTGLSFEVTTDTYIGWSELLQVLEQGDVAFVPQLTRTPAREGQFIWPQTIMMTAHYLLISRLDFPDLKVNDIMSVKVGLIKDYSHTAMFHTWFPNHLHNIEFDNPEDTIAALEQGEIDVMMGSMIQLLSMINYQERSGFKANFVFNYTYDILPGFNREETVLLSIISKALDLIDIKGISDQWMRRTYDYQSKLLQARQPWFIGISILSFCILILVSAFFIKSRNTGKKLENLVRKRTSELENQHVLMSVVNDTAVLLLESDAENYVDVLSRSMEFICRHMDADRVYLWQNIRKEDGNLYYKQVCKWSVDKYAMDSKLFEFAYHNTLPKWEGIFSKGHSLNGPLDKLPDGERSFFKNYQIQSLLAVPLFLEGNFWGYASCDNCRTRRVFPQAEKHALQSWGLIAMGIIQRGEIAQDMRNTLTRSIELQKELEAAMEAAEAASNSKSAFLANMSHEIRTPMNSIVGFSELALDDQIAPNTQNYLSKILDNAEGLLHIINDILDISKIESGKMELEYIPFDLHEIFVKCQTTIMPKAMEEGVTVHFYAEPSINKKLVGDPTRLRQILVNFLSNAIKFTKFGTVKLSASIVQSTDNTIEVHFEVRDNGIGMTSDQIARIYEPFSQADSSTTRKYGGTGLGLPISKSMIEMMGGTLVAESTPGVGSKFSFSITFDTIDSPALLPANKMVISNLEKPVFDGEILVCEDNPMNQQVVREHLARVGIKTVIAANGREGVDIVRERIEKNEKPFDLIFMDIHMPEMDGLEAATAMTAMGTKTPIIAMTANIMTNERERYKTSGMPDFVGKPFTSQELWRCLLKYLNPVDRKTINGSAQAKSDDDLQKMLQSHFFKHNQTKYKEIAKAIEMGDIKHAYILAHTLKSNAGQLGKKELQKIAGEIEDLLKGGKNHVTKEHLAILETEMDAVLSELASLMQTSLQETPIQKPPVVFDIEKAQELVRRLEPMLKNGNPECIKLIEDIRKTIPESEELVQQIDDFEFDLAVSTLARIQKGWNL